MLLYICLLDFGFGDGYTDEVEMIELMFCKCVVVVGVRWWGWNGKSTYLKTCYFSIVFVFVSPNFDHGHWLCVDRGVFCCCLEVVGNLEMLCLFTLLERGLDLLVLRIGRLCWSITRSFLCSQKAPLNR